MGVFHLCGFDGSQSRQGKNHRGSGILLSPGTSRVHPHKGKQELGAKNHPQGGLWCKESGGEPIKGAERK